jgi:hypothetical protein
MRKWGWVVALAALAATSTMAQTSFPDLRGTWKGESESIVTDSGNPHDAGQPSSGPKPSSVPFTMTIDKQDGRRFSGNFLSPRSSETIIGVLTRAGQPAVGRHRRLFFWDIAGPGPARALLSPDRHIWPGGVLPEMTRQH